MNRLIFIIFVLFSVPSLAQKTKKIKVDDYDLFAKHEYHVLKKDKTIKHGPYKSTWVNGNPRQEGFYHFGKKDSLWTYYNRFKPIVGSRGYYENGSKEEIWEYYDDKGKLMNRYDHSNHFLSYTTFRDTVKKYLIKFRDTIADKDTTRMVKLEQPPLYLEGEKNKFRIIQDNIVYPPEAIELNIFGTVYISFFVNEYGQAIEHSIMQGIGGGCDEEALRVVKLIPNEWAVARFEGSIVSARVIVPITFQLN